MDVIEILKGGGKSRTDSFVGRPTGHSHEFYLSGHVEEASEYIEWFDTIRHAGENDFVKIYINSPGGDLFTTIQFMRVLAETDATVCCSVEGLCMSAATMIFLCADQFEVTPHSMFMFHNYSGGTIGKGGEMIDQLKHERAWSEKLMREAYEGFLTEDEITSILDNKDIWMGGDDIVTRLKGKVAHETAKLALASEMLAVVDEEDDDDDVVVSTPTKKKLTVKSKVVPNTTPAKNPVAKTPQKAK
jgi:ATP-dependent protease ClpP protease subunit